VATHGRKRFSGDLLVVRVIHRAMNTFVRGHELLSTHEAIDSLFATIVRSARAGDWSGCQAAGSDFAIALDVHLRHEESVQFPAYAGTSAAAADEVRTLEAEHRRIRKFIGKLLAGVQHGVLRADLVDQVASLLREHDARESERFRPWLEASRHH
jgi:hypothetical protein